jgi:hypothetical protein
MRMMNTTAMLRKLPTGVRYGAVAPVAALGMLGIAMPLSGGGHAEAAKPAAAVASATPGTHAPVRAPAGVSDEQVKNAQAIAQAAAERHLPPQAVTVALATALQESGLKNINYGDRDSVGLFQQRPSAGWGSADQIMNPHYAAGKFLDHLAQVPGWQDMKVTDAAQTVQRSGFPEAYQKWVPLATDLTHQVSNHK